MNQQEDTTIDDAGHRPNVVVFMTDQQRWDTIGASGSPLRLTPNLDLACRRGTTFEVACSPNPVCAPTRASLQTGRYPTQAGVHRNGKVLAPEVPSLGRLFSEAGYRTGYVGKWHLGSTNPVPRHEQGGYDEWLGSNLLEFTSDSYRTVVYEGDGTPRFLPGYRADALVDAAIRFIADGVADERPFLLFVSLIEPHHQNESDDYPAPEVYSGTYADAWVPPDLRALAGGTAPQHLPGYYGMIKRVDEAFGRLQDALKSLGIDDETVVAFTSDHGSHFKTRNAEYKRAPQDSSIRVPLVIKGPGFVPGERVTRPVSLVDVVPTLLESARIAAPDGMDGRALQGASRDPGRTTDVLIQVSESLVGRALRTERWKYFVAAPDSVDVPGADRYVEAALYDLESDPYELNNLIENQYHDAVCDDLRERLRRRIADVEAVWVTIDADPIRTAGGQPGVVGATRLPEPGVEQVLRDLPHLRGR